MSVKTLTFLLALSGLTGCTSYRYTIVEEDPVDVGAVSNAPRVCVRPLSVSFKPPHGWMIPQTKWRQHVEGFQSYFRRSFPKQIAKHELKQGTAMVGAGATPEDAVLLVVDLIDIKRGARQRPTWTTATVTLTDGESGDLLYTAKLKTSSYTGSSWGFLQQVNATLDHYCHAVATLLRDGQMARTPPPK